MKTWLVADCFVPFHYDFFLQLIHRLKGKIDINLSKISYTSVNADSWDVCGMYKHLLLTKFEVHALRCGPNFFLLIYGPSPSARVIISGRTRECVTYNTDRKNEVNKIFIISEVNQVRGKRRETSVAGQ